MSISKKTKAKGTGKTASEKKKPVKKKGAISKKSSAKKTTVKKADNEKNASIKKKTSAKKKTVTGSKRAKPSIGFVPEDSSSGDNAKKEAGASQSPLSSLLHDYEPDDASGESVQVEKVEMLVFNMKGKKYAFRVADVEEIIQSQKTTFVPRTKEFVIGITTVMGKIVPVIDIAMLMDASEMPEDLVHGKIVVLKGPSGPVGVRMHRDMNIVLLPENEIQPPPRHLAEREHAFITGVVKIRDDFVSILDTETMLSVPTARGAYEGEA